MGIRIITVIRITDMLCMYYDASGYSCKTEFYCLPVGFLWKFVVDVAYADRSFAELNDQHEGVDDFTLSIRLYFAT